MSERQLSYGLLAEQASTTAAGYLRAAIATVEETMGKGAAAKHPEIVAAVVKAAALDYHASMFSHRVCPALEDVADAIKAAGESIGLSIDSVASSMG
jgi:hypothetical protein